MSYGARCTVYPHHCASLNHLEDFTAIELNPGHLGHAPSLDPHVARVHRSNTPDRRPVAHSDLRDANLPPAHDQPAGVQPEKAYPPSGRLFHGARQVRVAVLE